MAIETIRTGYKSLDPEMQSVGIDWALVPPHYTDEQALQAFGVHCGEPYYTGPGMPFANRAIIRRTNGHCLITQRCGIDI